MEVIWFHGQTNSRIVHHYKYESDYVKDQHQDYQGRTEFIREEIYDGIVTLKLHNIRPSDVGKYRCYFESRHYNTENEFQVYVADKGSASHIYLKGDENKMLQLVCVSTGWYPEPEVYWRKNQENLLAQDTMIKKNEDGLFSVETSIIVSPDSAMNVSCFIQNPLLNQTLEANISLADALCPNDSSWMLTWSVTLVLASTVFCNLIFQNQELKKAKDKFKTERAMFKAECEKLHIKLAKLQDEFDKLLQAEIGQRIAPENPEKPTPQEPGMEKI
ncbi:butyrophilin-like protein 9 isoform X2 [Macrotis lagotis]|uniref:butyrophilin-like protein 9 isoform X2 n=1 Tax=Macrotis lagotis TaxID=92651 RepID=UPI003D69C722